MYAFIVHLYEDERNAAKLLRDQSLACATHVCGTCPILPFNCSIQIMAPSDITPPPDIHPSKHPKLLLTFTSLDAHHSQLGVLILSLADCACIVYCTRSTCTLGQGVVVFRLWLRALMWLSCVTKAPLKPWFTDFQASVEWSWWEMVALLWRLHMPFLEWRSVLQT